MWWECHLRESSEKRVTWGGHRGTRGMSEHLQHAKNVTDDGAGEVPGNEEGEGDKKRAPAYVQHRAHSS